MQNELIILGVALVAAIVATLVFGRKPKATKKFARGTTWIAFLMVLILVVNMILSGPMFSIVNMALNPDVPVTSARSPSMRLPSCVPTSPRKASSC